MTCGARTLLPEPDRRAEMRDRLLPISSAVAVKPQASALLL
jgi:hypothetical protein